MMDSNQSHKHKSALKFTEINSPLYTEEDSVDNLKINNLSSSLSAGRGQPLKRRVKFSSEKPIIFTEEEIVNIEHNISGSKEGEEWSLYEIVAYRDHKDRKKPNINMIYKYFGDNLIDDVDWGEDQYLLCDACRAVDKEDRTPCKECSKHLFYDLLESWTFHAHMDLKLIPDPGNLEGTMQMYNPYTKKHEEVPYGKFSSLETERPAVHEVGSRLRDVWCYSKLVQETPLPPNSYIREAKYGGNNRRRSSLSHCRNLVPKEAPESDSPYKQAGIVFARKQNENWTHEIDPMEYLKQLGEVEYPGDSGIKDLLGLFERYRDLDFLIQRYNSPSMKIKTYVKKFVSASDIQSLSAFFALLEAESKSFAPTVIGMEKLKVQGTKRKKRWLTQKKSWDDVRKAQAEQEESVQIDDEGNKSFPAGVYEMGFKSISSLLEEPNIKRLFPKRWEGYAVFLGEPDPIQKFADKWNDWKNAYDICFNTAIIAAILGNKFSILESLLSREVPKFLQKPERDSEPTMKQRLIYADAFYSRPRRKYNSCTSECYGHQGKLFLLLVNLGRRKMINYIIKQGFNINTLSCDGQTVSLRWDDETRALKSRFQFVTPLSIAAFCAASGESGSYKLVKTLISHSADVLICENAALRACTSLLPSLEGLEYATKDEKKRIKNGALTIKKIMNIMREERELEDSYCTTYLLYQSVLEKRWDSMVCLSVQPTETKTKATARFSFKRDGYYETLSFDRGACKVSLKVIDILLEEMELEDPASYSRYILGIIALLEYNQFTLDEDRFERLGAIALRALNLNRPYDITAIYYLLQLEQFRHFLGLERQVKWDHRVVTDLIEGKPKPKNNTNAFASKTVGNMSQNRPKPVTRQADSRSSFQRVAIVEEEKKRNENIVPELLLALASTGFGEPFSAFLNEPVVIAKCHNFKLLVEIGVNAAVAGHTEVLGALIKSLQENRKSQILKEAFRSCLHACMKQEFCINSIERILESVKEHGSISLFENVGLDRVLRLIRYMFTLTKLRNEPLLRQLTKGVVLMISKNHENIKLNDFLVHCLNLNDRDAKQYNSVKPGKKGRNKRSIVAPRMDFRKYGITWFRGIQVFMEEVIKAKGDLPILEVADVATRWISLKDLKHPRIKFKGYRLLTKFCTPLTYHISLEQDLEQLLTFLCDYCDEVIDFLNYLAEKVDGNPWKQLMQEEIPKLKNQLEHLLQEPEMIPEVAEAIENGDGGEEAFDEDGEDELDEDSANESEDLEEYAQYCEDEQANI